MLIYPSKKVVFKGFTGKSSSPDLVFHAVYIELDNIKQTYGVIFSNEEDSVNRRHVICSIEHLENTLKTKVFPNQVLSSGDGMEYVDLKNQMDLVNNNLVKAFEKLDEGVTQTVNSFNKANSSFYKTIDKAFEKRELSILKEKADSTKILAGFAVALLENYKVDMFSKTGGFDKNGLPIGKDDHEFGFKYLKQKNRGDSIVSVINDFKDFFISDLEEYDNEKSRSLVQKYAKLLDTGMRIDPFDPDGQEVSFIHALSADLPLAAVTANLTLWQSYLKNAEADYISFLAFQIEKQ